MKRWLLDTSALLALRDDEAGADRVAALLNQAQAGHAECYGCFMSLVEVYYRVWKDESEAGATLVHKDPEFAALKLKQEVLPLK